MSPNIANANPVLELLKEEFRFDLEACKDEFGQLLLTKVNEGDEAAVERLRELVYFRFSTVAALVVCVLSQLTRERPRETPLS